MSRWLARSNRGGARLAPREPRPRTGGRPRGCRTLTPAWAPCDERYAFPGGTRTNSLDDTPSRYIGPRFGVKPWLPQQSRSLAGFAFLRGG